MRAYGVPRNHDVEAPDLADISLYGFKSCVGQPKGNGGETHNSFRNPNSKARSRRVWARKARASGKAACTIE